MRLSERFKLAVLAPVLTAGFGLMALDACKIHGAAPWTTSTGTIPTKQNPTCFSTGVPAPWQKSVVVPGGIITDRGNLLLQVGPNLTLNTAFMMNPWTPDKNDFNGQGFHDDWYGKAVTLSFDVQASGIDQDAGQLTAPANGNPFALNMGGTIEVYRPWASGGGYQPSFHDNSVLTISGQTPVVRTASGTYMTFDSNGWLVQTCADSSDPAQCTVPLLKFTRDAATGHLLSISDYSTGAPKTRTFLWGPNASGPGGTACPGTNAAGRLSGTVFPDGSQWCFDYTTSGLFNTATPPMVVPQKPSKPWVFTATPGPNWITVQRPQYKSGMLDTYTFDNNGRIESYASQGDPRLNFSIAYTNSAVGADGGTSNYAVATSMKFTNSYNDSVTWNVCKCGTTPSYPFTNPTDANACFTTQAIDQYNLTHTTEYTADGKEVALNDPITNNDAFRVVGWSTPNGEYPTMIKTEGSSDVFTMSVDESHQGRIVAFDPPSHIVTTVNTFAADGKWYAFNQPETWTVGGNKITPFDYSPDAGPDDAGLTTPTTVGAKYTRIAELDGGVITVESYTSDCPACKVTETITVPTAAQGLKTTFVDWNGVGGQVSCDGPFATCTASLTAGSKTVFSSTTIQDPGGSVLSYKDSVNTNVVATPTMPGGPIKTVADMTANQQVAFQYNSDTGFETEEAFGPIGGNAMVDCTVNIDPERPDSLEGMTCGGVESDQVLLAADPASGGDTFAAHQVGGGL